MNEIDAHDALCDDLLRRTASGERDALGRLFASEAGRLIAIARRIVRRAELAEEVVQDSFVAAWRNAHRFDPMRGRARAWLTTIVRNRALNMVRDGARLDLVAPDEMAAHSDRGSEADAAFVGLDESHALRRCLDQLEAPRRRSVLLAYVVGHTHGEIAAELRVPVGTVKTWIRRSVIALQECLS